MTLDLEKAAQMSTLPWEEYPDSVILPAGTAQKYDVSGWRYMKPVLDPEKCTDCGMCWLYCPDNAVIFENGKMKGFLYQHCKGCSYCAQVCPVNAITMVEEIK